MSSQYYFFNLCALNHIWLLEQLRAGSVLNYKHCLLLYPVSLISTFAVDRDLSELVERIFSCAITVMAAMTVMETEIGTTKRRILILFIFAFFSLVNAIQWVEYSILPDLFTEYYNVSYATISWTTLSYGLSMVLLLLRVEK